MYMLMMIIDYLILIFLILAQYEACKSSIQTSRISSYLDFENNLTRFVLLILATSYLALLSAYIIYFLLKDHNDVQSREKTYTHKCFSFLFTLIKTVLLQIMILILLNNVKYIQSISSSYLYVTIIMVALASILLLLLTSSISFWFNLIVPNT